MKLLPSVFSCLYSRVKIFVFVVKSKRHFFYFCVDYLRITRKENKSEIIFAVCRLSALNVILNLFCLLRQLTLNLINGRKEVMVKQEIRHVLNVNWYKKYFGTVEENMALIARCNDSFLNQLDESGREEIACVAGGISCASAFVLVAKPRTRLAKPWED